MRVAALYAPSAQMLQPGTGVPAPAIVPGDARLLAWEQWGWVNSHMDTLYALAEQARTDAPTLIAQCVLMDAGVFRPRFGPIEEDPGPVWIAPSGRSLNAAERRTLEAAIRAFLAEQGVLDVPAVVNIEIPDPHAPPGRPELPVLDLAVLQPVDDSGPLGVLGDVMTDGAGERWLIEYGTNDESQSRLMAAALYREAGVALAQIRAVTGPLNALYTAMHLPEGLKLGEEALSDPGVRRSFLQGVVADAWLGVRAVYEHPDAAIGALDGSALRVSTGGDGQSALPRMVTRLSGLLQVSPHTRPPFGALMGEEITLGDVARGIRSVMRVDNATIAALGARYPLSDPEAERSRRAALAARRDFLGSMSFLARAEKSYYEPGTSPEDIRGKVVARVVDAAVRELTQPPSRGFPAATAGPRDEGMIAPDHPLPAHFPHYELVERVLELLRDPDYLRHPIDRGGVRLVYPIPGEPFLFKLNRRAAEALIRWRARYGGPSYPASVFQEGERYAARLNFRTQTLTHHLGEENVYPELAFLVPEVHVPGGILTGLQGVAGNEHVLPVLGSVQRIFSYIDAPGTLEIRAPYAERGPEPPSLREYANTFHAWVLNLFGYGMSDISVRAFMRTHSRSTAERFIDQCTREEALLEQATAFFKALICKYCPATQESIDLSGPRNGFWYVNEAGERKVALLDMLFPEDKPILLGAAALMERFLHGEPLTVTERLDLLNAINFTRFVNFMAYQLNISQRIELFPDPVMKGQVSLRIFDLLEMMRSIPRPGRLIEPHPEEPWGVF